MTNGIQMARMKWNSNSSTPITVGQTRACGTRAAATGRGAIAVVPRPRSRRWVPRVASHRANRGPGGRRAGLSRREGAGRGAPRGVDQLGSHAAPDAAAFALEEAFAEEARVSSRRRRFASSSRFASKCLTQLAGQAFSYALRRVLFARRAPPASKQAKYASRACRGGGGGTRGMSADVREARRGDDGVRGGGDEARRARRDAPRSTTCVPRRASRVERRARGRSGDRSETGADPRSSQCARTEARRTIRKDSSARAAPGSFEFSSS